MVLQVIYDLLPVICIDKCHDNQSISIQPRASIPTTDSHMATSSSQGFGPNFEPLTPAVILPVVVVPKSTLRHVTCLALNLQWLPLL